MKQQQSRKGLNAAIWLLAVGPGVLLILWTLNQDAKDAGVIEHWLRTLPFSLLVSVVTFAVLRELISKHGEQEVRSATERAAKVLGPFAIIGLLLLVFGLPLFFLWLGGSIWGGQ